MNSFVSLPSPSEIATVIFRRKWVLLAAFLIPLVACATMPFLISPVYEAHARLLVKAGREFIPQSDLPGGSQTSPATTMREIVDTVAQILTSADLVRDVLQEVTVGRLYPDIASAEPAAAAPEDAAMRAFIGDFLVTPVRLTNVIEIRLRNGDRRTAVEALTAALTRFQERHVQAFRNSRTQSLETEIANNLRLLTETQAERAAYVTTHSLFSLNEQRVMLMQQRVRRAMELQDAEMRDVSLDRLSSYLKAELDRQPSTITLQTTVQASTVAEDVQRRIQDLRQRERQLLATLSSEHPQVRAVRASIAATQQDVAQTAQKTAAVSTGINPLITTLRTQLASAEADRAPIAGRIAALKTVIEADDARLGQISEVEAGLRQLDYRIADLEASTSSLRQRLSYARVSDQLDSAHVAGLSVIQHPIALDRPISPRKLYFFLGGIVLSLLAGGAAVLAALTLSNRFIAAETIERLLGAPVLVVLPAGRIRHSGVSLLQRPATGATV